LAKNFKNEILYEEEELRTRLTNQRKIFLKDIFGLVKVISQKYFWLKYVESGIRFRAFRAKAPINYFFGIQNQPSLNGTYFFFYPELCFIDWACIYFGFYSGPALSKLGLFWSDFGWFFFESRASLL